MVNTLFDTVWRDISPFAVGFDRTFDALSIMANSKSQSINYPPYNIRKVSDEKYTIELGVAGFEEDDIDVEVQGESLIISQASGLMRHQKDCFIKDWLQETLSENLYSQTTWKSKVLPSQMACSTLAWKDLSLNIVSPKK